MRAVRSARVLDRRVTFEAVHDAVLARLDETRTAEYLLALFNFRFEDGRAAYVALAEPFLEPHEKEMLAVTSALFLDDDVCTHCGRQHQWELDEARGERVCACGNVCRVAAGAYSYDGAAAKYLPFDRRERATQHAYRRVSHFTNCVASLMRRQLPNELRVKVEAEVQRQHIDPSRLVLNRVRQLMKQVGEERRYPLAPALLAHLLKREVPRLRMREMDVLFRLFDELQRAFDEIIDVVEKGRHNFVAYSYLLKQCLHHMGRDDIGCWLPPLKTVDKQRKQERIFLALRKRAEEWDTSLWGTHGTSSGHSSACATSSTR